MTSKSTIFNELYNTKELFFPVEDDVFSQAIIFGASGGCGALVIVLIIIIIVLARSKTRRKGKQLVYIIINYLIIISSLEFPFKLCIYCKPLTVLDSRRDMLDVHFNSQEHIDKQFTQMTTAI